MKTPVQVSGAVLARWVWLCLALAVLALGSGGSVAAVEENRDPVAAWEIMRADMEQRVNRLPPTGATLLILPVGAPAGQPPGRLTAEQIEAIIEKLDLYAGPDAPVHLDGVVLEINARETHSGDALEKMDQLINALQIHDFPVIAWIHNAALDQAAWIALSADRIFLAPPAMLGGGPADPLRDFAEQNDPDSVAWVRENSRYAGAVAASKGYNRDLAKAMMDGSVALVRAAIDGRPYVLTAETLAKTRQARPGAAIEPGPVYKKSGDRLLLDATEAQKPEIHLAQGVANSTDELFARLGLSHVHTVTLSFVGPPPATITRGLQAGLLLLIVLMAVLLIVGELILQTRGYAFVAAGGTILAYLSWSAETAPLGGVAMGLFVCAVGLFIFELLRPSRRGLLGVTSFAMIGCGLALSLVHDLPFVSAGWSDRHMAAEFRPALQNFALVVIGGTLAAAAIGLITMAKVRRLPRYLRRWRKRFTHFDEALYLELQTLRGRYGVSLTPVHSLGASGSSGASGAAGAGNAVGEGARRVESTGRVSIGGRQYEATCVGAIAAGCDVEVLDCTEDRLIVRFLASANGAVAPFGATSKYEAAPENSKYRGDAAATDRKYPAAEAGAAEGQRKYGAQPPAEDLKYSGDGEMDLRKYPPAATGRKYGEAKPKSKYTPPGGTPTQGGTAE